MKKKKVMDRFAHLYNEGIFNAQCKTRSAAVPNFTFSVKEPKQCSEAFVNMEVNSFPVNLVDHEHLDGSRCGYKARGTTLYSCVKYNCNTELTREERIRVKLKAQISFYKETLELYRSCHEKYKEQLEVLETMRGMLEEPRPWEAALGGSTLQNGQRRSLRLQVKKFRRRFEVLE